MPDNKHPENEHIHDAACDCGCDHEHTHDDHCDCGCEDEQVVLLQDADGNEVAFHYVYNMEHEGKEYVFLQAVDASDEDDAIEIFSVHTEEENGEYFDMLDPVDDDLYDVLYEKLLLVASEDACEDDDDCDDNCDECDDEDCVCHDCDEETCDDCVCADCKEDNCADCPCADCEEETCDDCDK